MRHAWRLKTQETLKAEGYEPRAELGRPENTAECQKNMLFRGPWRINSGTQAIPCRPQKANPLRTSLGQKATLGSIN